MSDSRTQSVCVCPGKKHPGRIYCLICLLPYEPVPELASTGEQPPKTVSLWPTCNFCGTELEKHPSGAGICPKCGAMKFPAARPSEPTAPQCPECKTQLRDETAWYRCDKCHARYSSSMERGLYRLPDDRFAAPQPGYCPYHGEKIVPIFGGQWNGCPKCPRDADGFTPVASQASAELTCQKCVEGIHGHCSGDCECRLSKCNLKVSAPQPVSGDAPERPYENLCEALSDKSWLAAPAPAPSPTPSVSTELPYCQDCGDSEEAIIHQLDDDDDAGHKFKPASEKRLKDCGGDGWCVELGLEQCLACAAPSVAGMQPTPDTK